MRILLIHNKYQLAGGEDLVFESEGKLLAQYHHLLEQLIFDNKEIKNTLDRVLLGLKAFYNRDSQKELEERIERFKPDIIHVHNFVPIASPSIFYTAKRYKIPVIVTLHNFRLICPSATLFYDHKIYEKSVHSILPLDAIFKGVYRNSRVQTAGMVAVMSFHNLIGTWRNKVDKFIVLTEFARNKFRHSALRASEGQFVLKPNFITDPGNGKVNRDEFFMFIGRLSEEKGIDTLLNASKLHNFKLTIIGDGPMRKKVEDFAAATSNIDYMGFQQKPVILELLKRCKALLFTSVCYEGFPLTILEALATGTPVIGSRIGGVPEIITDNFNGLLFEAGNENDMIRKIIQMEQIELAKILSENARKTYLERYTPEKNYKMLLEIYDMAIASALKIK